MQVKDIVGKSSAFFMVRIYDKYIGVSKTLDPLKIGLTTQFKLQVRALHCNKRRLNMLMCREMRAGGGLLKICSISKGLRNRLKRSAQKF